jgi:16S rRNA (cytidine1402-2'-O)-methyltransferase
MVFFEAPHRTEQALVALVEAFGGVRRAAVCRELTKTHEEVRRGPLAELVTWAADGVRGEVTLVVSGAAGVGPADLDDEAVRALVAAEVEAGMTTKDAVATVARRTGIPKKTVYAAAHR